MKEHDTEWEPLKSELLDAVREGVAHAEALSMEAQDRQVVEEERAFRARFRCDRPRRDRENLIRLKHEADLTDSEIRLLLLNRSIRFDADRAHLAASRGLAVFGRVVLGFLGLELLEAWNLASHSPMPWPSVVLRLVGVVMMLLAFAWLVQQVYLRPWQIQRRVSVRSSEAADDGLYHRR